MNKYYCILPFYSVETEFSNPDKNIFCCRLSKNTDINEVRESIRLKQRSSNCATCWALEDKGLKSERQIHNETMDFLLDLNLENIELASLNNGFDPIKIKLATSNLCNGQCVTCGSHSSSAWASLEGKSTSYKSMDLTKLDSAINWADIVSLSFVGGEPLLEKKNFIILKKLIEHNNTNCFISVVTNGSIELSEYQIDILRQFNKLNICLSIDGVGTSFEYMRYPLKWDKFIFNLELFKKLTNNISVSCMISNLNIYYYTNMIDFFKEHSLNYLCKQITNPSIFSPANLPAEVKKIIIENNKKYINEVESFLQISQFDSNLFVKFKQELIRQENLKSIKLQDYMPEVSNLL